MKKTILIISLVLVCGLFLSADVYIKQNTHSDAVQIMGQSTPEKNEVNHMWIGKNKMAMHGKDGSFIVDLDKKHVLMINHSNKTYIPMTIPIDLDAYFPPQLMQMMGDVKVSISPTGNSKTIGTWKCEEYTMEMNMMMFTTKGTIYATTDVPFDWKEYQQEMYASFAQATMRLSEESVMEFQKIKGFQIQTEMIVNMMGTEMKTVQIVEEIAKKDAPAGTYDAPSDYTKQDKFSLQDLQKR
ncbi:MAG: hypothetical protein KKD56_07895 [Acidobacteria bacterium]|nr:hypothetical protein [Acidobacteriota bacterium]MCG2816260.1 hypothetical protein [Candidatus Aminicenantes bacterium]MBU1473763.1 hypothetical protein [Acidobacteriota bacterium]MBU2439294.1 hypothetical protein [Acidobacteriota bacterium]MBU4253784.1 hypothetical protein [Acidobacteriota bacterium]